jgi:hypothetical protein
MINPYDEKPIMQRIYPKVFRGAPERSYGVKIARPCTHNIGTDNLIILKTCSRLAQKAELLAVQNNNALLDCHCRQSNNLVKFTFKES